MWPFASGFFHSTCLQGPTLLQHVSECHFFLGLNNIPLHGDTTFCLSIHQWLKDIWRPLWILCQRVWRKPEQTSKVRSFALTEKHSHDLAAATASKAAAAYCWWNSTEDPDRDLPAWSPAVGSSLTGVQLLFSQFSNTCPVYLKVCPPTRKYIYSLLLGLQSSAWM